MEYSDLDLVRGIQAGDKSALDILVRRWYPRIYGYIIKMIENEQDAYDLTQDVFIAMMQSVSAFYPWKKFSSWLFTIAHNKCMDYFRIQKRFILTDLIDINKSDTSPLLDDSVADSVVIEKALMRLSVVQREAIVLHYFDQFTAKEISRLTHTPLPTIKSRLASAKRLLSKLLLEDFL